MLRTTSRSATGPNGRCGVGEEATSERFWSKVDRSGGPDACWPWLGSIANGYGQFRAPGGRRIAQAHVFAWTLVNGPMPPGRTCGCHSCDVRYPEGSIAYRKCCNPAHVWPGSRGENNSDRKAKGRSACGTRNGRPKLTESNVREIRAALAGGTLQRILAVRYGVSGANISYIKRGIRWAGVA
jgi:hypothetical protein